jgi:polyisoprenyl-phosphate glycosyltransferase
MVGSGLPRLRVYEADIGGSDLPPTLSIVVPAYNEAGNLPRLLAELAAVLDGIGATAEIIIVDDGSTDGTWSEIARLHQLDPRVRGVRFSRNFGHQYALFAGLCHSRGQAVISMDADLQHPPSLIPTLVSEWQSGHRVVHTVRVETQRASLFKRITSRVFYAVFSFLGGVRLDPGMADFRLFDRRVVDTITRFGESGLFLRGLVHWIGFDSVRVPFTAPERFNGVTKYTLRRMVRFSIDGITSFSIVPLRLGILAGVVTSGLAFLEIAYAVYAKFVLGTTVAGWATTIVVMSFMFGVLFVLIGLLGEYMGRILTEVRGRPRFIVADAIGAPAPAVNAGMAPMSASEFTDDPLRFEERATYRTPRDTPARTG